MDSAVCTALLLAALGPEKVIVVHIDNGFMRKAESEGVKTCLEALGLRLHGRCLHTVFVWHCMWNLPSLPPSLRPPPSTVYDAAQRFYTAQTIISVHTELGVEEKVTLPLQSVTSPEEKRAIIGNTFMRVRGTEC